MKNEKNTIAVFDFDGTITRCDTFRDFFIWSFGSLKFYLSFVVTAPFIVLYLIGLVSNDFPKLILFRWFFRKTSEKKFNSICLDYAEYRLPELIRSSALERIRWHKQKGHTLIINSASLSDWIRPWAVNNGFDYIIATTAHITGGVLTGGFEGRCSYGQEKVAGLERLNFTKENSFIYAYGDGRGDRELLEIADYPKFRAFH